MRYAFFGSPRFASLVLSGIMDEMPPAAVVANPDRPAGRKKTLTPPAVKALLLEKGSKAEILQPEKIAEIEPRLRELRPDIFVVAAYGKIIPQSTLDIPRLGTVGVHPSTLPLYRGATPIQSAILGGESETGATLYLMDSKVDHGPILAHKGLKVGDMAYPELEASLAALGAELLLQTLPKLMDGSIEARAQDENKATFTSKFGTEDAFIPWQELEMAMRGDSETAVRIFRKIRAFDPEPGAWTRKGAERVKLLAAEMEDGRLALRRIQRDGKKPEMVSGYL